MSTAMSMNTGTVMITGITTDICHRPAGAVVTSCRGCCLFTPCYSEGWMPRVGGAIHEYPVIMRVCAFFKGG